MNIIRNIFLIVWTLFWFSDIYEHISQYTIYQWIIILLVMPVPYIIAWLTSEKRDFSWLFNKKNQKNTKLPASEEDNPPIDDDSKENRLPPNTDFIKTIFLSQFEKHPYKEDDSFPEYFYYEYGIINISRFFNELKNEGLICPSPPEDILGMMKVVDLKDILTEHNLKKTVNKPVLIERILSNLDISKIPLANEPYYSLSYKGKKFVTDHYDYIKLKQNPEWGISFWQYQNEKEKSSGTVSFNDIILSLLNVNILKLKKTSSEIGQFEYFKLQDLYISAYELLLEKEEYELALKALLKCVLLALSGCKNNWLIGYKRGLQLKNDEVMKNYAPVEIDSYIASSICKLQEYYSEDISKKSYQEFIGPFNLCTYEMFCEVMELIFNSSILDLSKYNLIIKKLFIKKLK